MALGRTSADVKLPLRLAKRVRELETNAYAERCRRREAMKKSLLPPASAWFVVDEDGWLIRGPFTRRTAAIEARKRVDTMAPLRVVAYDPRLAKARKVKR